MEGPSQAYKAEVRRSAMHVARGLVKAYTTDPEVICVPFDMEHEDPLVDMRSPGHDPGGDAAIINQAFPIEGEYGEL